MMGAKQLSTLTTMGPKQTSIQQMVQTVSPPSGRNSQLQMRKACTIDLTEALSSRLLHTAEHDCEDQHSLVRRRDSVLDRRSSQDPRQMRIF